MALEQKWNRLKTVVRGIAASINSEPKQLASLQPLAEDAINILSGKASSQGLEDVAYIIQQIETFVAKWRPSPRPNPRVLYIQPQWAQSTDNGAQEAQRIVVELRSEISDVPEVQSTGGTMKLFISHSSADKIIAEAFVKFLRSGLPIVAKDIRCTSVDGFKLSAGTNSDDQLKQEIFDAQVFLALLSPVSMQSIYVMFELGARWGSRRYLAPIMVAGLLPSSLKPPLSAIHAISGTSEGDLHQLIDDLSSQLQIAHENPAVYKNDLAAFINVSQVL